MNQHHRPSGFKLLPEVIKNILILNGIFFAATLLLQSFTGMDLRAILGLYYPKSPEFEPYQLLSHLFLHGNFMHIFFNMFALWMFGSVLENVLGGQRIFIYYFVTGFGAAALHLGVIYLQAQSLEAQMTADQLMMITHHAREAFESGMITPKMQEYYYLINTPTVGASGAVFGLLLAFGLLFPNSYLYLFFLMPIKAKWFVILFGALEIYSGIANTPGDNVAHFAHVGGMLFGFILLKVWGIKRFN